MAAQVPHSPFAIWVHRWLVAVTLWALLALTSCSLVTLIWDGVFVRGPSFEDWLQAVEGDGPNQATARDQLYLHVRRAIRALKADGAEREMGLLRKEFD